VNVRVIYRDAVEAVMQCRLPWSALWATWFGVTTALALDDFLDRHYGWFAFEVIAVLYVGVDMVRTAHRKANDRRARAARDAAWSRRVAELNAARSSWQRPMPWPRFLGVNPHLIVPGTPWKSA
jgi:hypothetical protein